MSGCELPFWKDPAALFNQFNLSYKADCDSSKWNFAARLAVMALAVGLVGMPVAGAGGLVVAVGLAAVIAAVIIMSGSCQAAPAGPRRVRFEGEGTLTLDEAGYGSTAANAKPVKGAEGFTNVGPSNGTIVSEVYGMEATLPYNDAAPYSGPALPESMLPTARNLFMNVLLDEYKYNPERPAAAPVTDPLVKQTLDDYFRVQWFSDPTDVFGKNQNQRQFVTMPSTSIPNDRDSYQKWLYALPGTCKSGDKSACLPGTDGGPVAWLNQEY
jgi:hypothetical protein